MCRVHKLSIAEIMMANERVYRGEDEIHSGIGDIWDVMKNCVVRGCSTDGVLPGGLNVKRRAKRLYEDLAYVSFPPPSLFTTTNGLFSIPTSIHFHSCDYVIVLQLEGQSSVL